MLRGAEENQRYRLDERGQPVVSGLAERLSPGEVEKVSSRDGDIHRVSNALADSVSISIHVYGGNIGGVRRAVYTPEGLVKPFVSGYSNRHLPNIWDLSKDDGAELALIDVREEADFARSHPLFAANLPLSKLELDIFRRVPRLTTPITVYDDGEGLAERAVERLQSWGYEDVALLEGGLPGWQRSGGELFQDVNSPSKAFGELVESERHTPSLSAREVQALLDGQQEVVVVDARRFDEYHTMNIPGSISVPGGELALRIEGLIPSPQATVIVNCAGRTRSIIGTQSLRNAGLPNPVYALRNGTIGWTLAGFDLERGQLRRYDADFRAPAERAAAVRQVAERAGVAFIDSPTLQRWLRQPARTTYLFDVRSPAGSWCRKPTISPACAGRALC